MATRITEEMGAHKEWYEAKPKTPAELAEFVGRLLADYGHDYGTICHAAAAAAIAAARCVDADPRSGGITGFQAGCIMWSFVRNWMHYEGALRLIQYDDMLYPQNADRFEKTITTATWQRLQEKAKESLSSSDGAHPAVRAHWDAIVSGAVPFGYRIKDDQ